MKFETPLRTTMAEAILARIQSGTASAPKLQIYNGTMPAAIGDAVTDDLLCELEMTNNVGVVSNGVLNFDAISDDPSANNTGEPGWARILNRDGEEIIYLTASVQGAGGEVQVNPETIAAGEPVSASLGIIRAGA